MKWVWRNFDKNRCIDSFKKVDWKEIIVENNVEIVNSKFEEAFCNIVDKEAPFKTIQTRTRYNTWLTEVTKTAMKERDIPRDKAKNTDDPVDWADFRKKRNDCTKRQSEDKRKHFKDLFENIENEKDSNKLFSMTKNLLNWKSAGPPCTLRRLEAQHSNKWT